MQILIARTIKYLREKAKLRQVDLSEAIGVSPRHVQKLEQGTVDFKSSTLEKIAQKLKVPPCYLLKAPLSTESGAANLFHCPIEILDLIPLGIQINDLNGLITYSNKYHRNLLGQYQDLSKTPSYIWDFLFDKNEVTKLKDYFKYLVNEQPVPAPYYTKNVKPDGSLIPIKVDWNYIRNAEGHLAGFISVITAHPSW